MRTRTSALVAMAAMLTPTVAMAEAPASPALHPVAYHVQMARGSTPSQIAAQRAAPTTTALPDSVRGSVGCLMTGTAGTAIAALAGGEEIINVVAGGGLPPTNRLVYMTGLLTVVFVSFCAVGQTMEPLYTHLMEKETAPAPHESIQIHRRHPSTARDVSFRTEAGAWPSPALTTAEPQQSFRSSLRQAIAGTGH